MPFDDKFERLEQTDIPNTPIRRSGFSLPHPGAPVPSPTITTKEGETFAPADSFDAQYASHLARTGQQEGQQQSAPPAAPPAAPAGPTINQTLRATLASRNESDIFKQLRQAFGINASNLIEAEFGGFKWTFRVPGSSDILWSVALMDEVLMLDSTMMTNMTSRRSIVAVSVAAINDVPLYKHFGIELPPGYAVPDPMNPPHQLRCRAAQIFYRFLSDEAFDKLTQGLIDIYEAQVNPLAEAATPLASTPPSPPVEKTQT